MSPWTLLLLSGLLEVVFTTLMKLSNGFKRPLPTAGFVVLAPASLWLLSQVLQSIPVGTAYAVWTGIGAVGTAVVGMVFFRDPVSWPRVMLLLVLVGAIVGLRFV